MLDTEVVDDHLDGAEAAAVDDAAPDEAVSDVAASDGAEADGARADTPFLEHLFTLVVLAACVGFVFWVCHPELIFRNTTPTGGDMGAHVWGPAFLRDHLLPNLRVTGWTPDWYNGFPAYTFYMVLPSLAIVALDVGFLPLFLTPLVAAGALYLWWMARDRVTNRLARAAVATSLVLVPILIIDVPYNVAFKMIAVSGIVTLPIACWWLGKGLGLSIGGPELMAVASVPFLMDKDLFHIYGGNIASTMAGEFAFSISLSLTIFFLGTMAMGIRTGKYRVPGVLLAAGALLCHVIPGVFYLGLGAVVLLVLRPTKRALKWILTTGPVAALIAAFWYLPFYGKSTFLNDMGWEKLGPLKNAKGINEPNLTEYLRYLLPFAPHKADSGTITSDPNMWFGKAFFVLAAVGAILSIVLVVRAGLFLTLMTLCSALAFWLMPQDRFWNARMLPLYYFCIYLLAAVGVWLLVRSLVLVFSGRWMQPPLAVSVVSVGVVMLVLAVGFGMMLRGLPFGGVSTAADGKTTYDWMGLHSTYENPTRYWAEWNFRGLEDKVAGEVNWSNEYFGVVNMMKKVGADHGCGRTMWEYDGDRQNNYGTPMAFMLFPYFTDGCIGSQEGLYFEASSTTPFHFIMQDELSAKCSCAQRFDIFGRTDTVYTGFDIDKGIKHMQMLGIRYYLADSERAKTAADADPRLKLIASYGKPSTANPAVNGPYNVYQVADAPLVRGLDHLPEVWTDVTDNIHDWAGPASRWFQDPSRFDVVPATSGPANWPRGTSKGKAVSKKIEPAKVTNVRSGTDSISFTVDQIGKPVLVTTSYFPNWEVSGATGPYRVAPNLMVVVPTQHDVELTYGRSGVEWLGGLLSVIGLALLAWYIHIGDRVTGAEPKEFLGDRERSDEPEPEPEPDEDAPLAGVGATGVGTADVGTRDVAGYDEPPPAP